MSSTPLSFWTVARRPRWIGALLLCLAIAAAFSALGQWQFERAVESAPVEGRDTEAIVALQSVAEPQGPVAEATGQLVEFSADFVPGDYLLLSDRVDETEVGYWVVGHAIVDEGPSIAVALGWTQSKDDAEAAMESLDSVPPASAIAGRYLPSESPQDSDFQAGQRSALALAELINVWNTPPQGVYGGYVTASDAPDGLTAIHSPAVSNEVSYNLMNVLYAIEWIIFGGFAVFLWYRLVRDVWEEEVADGQPDAATVE